MTICAVNKLDSNITGLSYAEEVCLRQLPSIANGDASDPVWRGLEPNSYNDFGGTINTVARAPISASRQRKKGTVVDLSAAGGFNNDLTQSNLIRLLQGFFFNDAAQKPTTQPLNGVQVALSSVATSDHSYNAASGLGTFLPKHIIFAKGFSNPANNGRKLVASVSAGKVTVAEALVDETAPPATGLIHAVGYRFASGELQMSFAAAAMTLTVSGLANASGALTFTGNAVAAETVTIAGKVYTWRVAPTTTANEVKIGANAAASIVNLVAAINGTGTPGTDYGSLTVKHALVKAAGTSTVLTVTAANGGTGSNGLATTQTMANASWGAATTTGGAGSVGWLALGLQVGEWLVIGGDDAVNTAYSQTSSTNRPGYARIASITDGALTFDDTTFAPQADTGTGRTIEVFFGTVLKNGTKTRSYQLERTLGQDASGTQSQYLEGAVANELTLHFPTGDKLNVDLGFIALNDVARTGAEGVKSGARVPAAGEEAYNSSLDIFRVRMGVVDPANINSKPLFGFVSEATITIGNNVSALKALGYLGGFDVSVGNFDAGGSITAYFSDVLAVKAIRANADVAFNMIVASHNAGMIYDIPLLGLGGGRLNVALNSSVTIPLEAAGAQNANGYTLLANFFPYLPTSVMPVQ